MSASEPRLRFADGTAPERATPAALQRSSSQGYGSGLRRCCEAAAADGLVACRLRASDEPVFPSPASLLPSGSPRRSLKHKTFSRGDLSTFGAEQEVRRCSGVGGAGAGAGPSSGSPARVGPSLLTQLLNRRPPCAPQLHHEHAGEAATDMQRAVEDAVLSAERESGAPGSDLM